MTTVPKTPLEDWIGGKTGPDRRRPLTRAAIEQYQLKALNRTLDHARRHSPFYRAHLSALPPSPLTGLDRLAELPFTTAADIRRDPLAFVCVSQSEIARVVTMESSGTTGRPKRLFFTAADLELTIDFFHHGMSTLVAPGQRVLILMPGQLPGSVGDLLVRALARMAVTGIVHGPVRDPMAAIDAAIAGRIDSLVGIPVQVLAMACGPGGDRLMGRIRTVLLSTDYVPDAIVRRIEAAWHCRVFRHYGMTETGLGGAVECAARDGYHPREADLVMEIVDPRTGRLLPDGATGELVVTTLTRQGMPLIRYRTGDMAVFRTAPCACSTVLRTLAAVQGRTDAAVPVGDRGWLALTAIDEALFSLESILNYGIQMDAPTGVDRLTLWIRQRSGLSFDDVAASVTEALFRVAAVREAAAAGHLSIRIRPETDLPAASTGSIKRCIHDQRERIRSHDLPV